MVVFVLQQFLQQIVFTVGIIVLGGFLVSVCNKFFYNNLGKLEKPICYVTGVIGTPIHESAHALMCLVFGHKITKIKFFQISSEEGTLGYVEHSYNPKSIYQRIGCFFIGIAPIIVISAILYLLAYLLLPEMVFLMNSLAVSISGTSSVGESFALMIEVVGVFINTAGEINWWIFVIVGIFLCLHMTLSKADIKSALSGIVVFLILILLIDIVLALMMVYANKPYLLKFTGLCYTVGGFILCFMILSVAISLVAVGVSFLVKIFLKKKGIKI